ncbi:MAG: aldehyde dehydrogenase family protein, partial [Desulfobacteraceae bacterium]|nr:aldehyde dehydrogenase family protein [Desulfobacteraceae bacterium]
MGNTVVLKPATSTPLGALILAEAAKAAGIPDGVINIIAGPGGELGNTLCTHPSVDKIAFTGSTEVGRQIMKMGADTVKKVTLELGGKSANIILDDADLDLAVEGALFGTFFHQGQVCESGTRVLVSAKIYDQFLDKMKARAQSLKIGYQLDPASHQGPLVSAAQLATVARAGASEAEAAIDAARKAFDSGVWSGLTPAARMEKINAFADQVSQQALRLAITEAMDSGHIIRLAKYWGMLGTQILRNYAHYAANHFPWEEEIPYAGNVFAPGRDFIRREPIGVCVGIIPWNFPLSMAFWKIAPAIAMGNTVVLKPATSTPLGALILAEAAKAAGIPDGVINI